jgi:glycosyltransferase involved in cell wall biosynthesis
MQRRLRIAVIAASFPPSLGGGVASAHHRLAELFEKHGHHVCRFAFLDDGASTQDIVRQSASQAWKSACRTSCSWLFRLLDNKGRAYQSADILESWPGARGLRRDLAAFAPDEIVLPDHGCPGLALGAPPTGARVTLIAHHNPMRFVNQAGLNPHSTLDAKLAVALENIGLRHVDRVVAPCRYMARCFTDTYRYSGPVEIIPNLIDATTLDGLPRADIRSSIGLAPSHPMIYIPSAGSRFKGSEQVPSLLEALAKSVAAPFGVFLSGAIPDMMRRRLPEGIPIFAPGSLSSSENLSCVKSCSLVVSPALIENFSMALLEAQLMGLPAAAFDIGGNAELIEQGVSGHLAPFMDVRTLAERAGDILSNPSHWSTERIAASCRLRFDPQLWIPRWLERDMA